MNIIFRLIFVFIFLKCESSASSVTTECYNKVGSGRDITCDSGAQLVSCGTKNTSGSSVGSYMIGDTCYARSGERPVARCCGLQTPSCSSYRSKLKKSDPIEGDKVATFCGTDEVLTGCTVDAYGFVIDGAFPFVEKDTDIVEDIFKGFTLPRPQRCTAQNGGSINATSIDPKRRYIFANARCCANDLKCGIIKSNGIVSCPTGLFLSGCSAYSSSMDVTQWYITDNDQCIAEAGAWAVAICCQEFVMSEQRDATKQYRDVSPMTVIVLSLSGVLSVFFILGLLAVVYCSIQLLLKNARHKSRYSVIDEQDTECEA